MDFIYYAPLRIVFAEGVISKIASYTSRNGSRVLLVTGKSHLRKTGVLDKILTSFSKSQKIEEVVVFDKAEENPDTQLINEAAKTITDKNLNVVVAVGGGSAMDLAKAASLSAKQKKPIEELMENGDLNILEAYPIICSPTTSGSGSEVTKYAVINNLSKNTKTAIGSETIYPKVSLIDPSLTYTISKTTIANTGFDALSHAIEAYISQSSSAITDAYCREAISLIKENLKKVYDTKDKTAMNNMSLASMLAGMALNVGRAALPHAMEHSLSAYNRQLPHGLGLSMVMIPFIKRTYKHSQKKFADIAYLMGKDISNMTLEDAAKKAVDAVEKIKASIGLTHKLSDFGFDKSTVNDMVKNTFHTMKHGIENSPKKFQEKEILDMYLEIL